MATWPGQNKVFGQSGHLSVDYIYMTPIPEIMAMHLYGTFGT